MIAPRRKWRPPLWMVTAGMIALVLGVAVVGFAAVRLNVDASPTMEIGTALAIALAAAAVVGFVFVRAIEGPLTELADRATRITHGDASGIGPLQRYGTREFAALSENFMGMASSLSRRSEFVRTYSRHVSHEFKTPITAIRGAAELLLDGPDMAPEQRRRFLENILADVERMTGLLDRMNQQALAESAAPGGAADVGEAIAALRDQFPDLAIALTGQARLAIAPQSLLIVLQHLAANAEQHGATRLDVAVEGAGEEVRLVVQDDGPGISEGNAARVFEPFFTTRRGEGGAGMGLTIVRAMLEAHRGGVRLLEAAEGARFEIRLPRA